VVGGEPVLDDPVGGVRQLHDVPLEVVGEPCAVCQRLHHVVGAPETQQVGVDGVVVDPGDVVGVRRDSRPGGRRGRPSTVAG
jgi:hypothetical protein